MADTVLITGSSGTVGTALALHMKKAGYQVLPLDIKASIWDSRLDHHTIRHDLRCPLAKGTIRTKPDVIVHLAANARVHDSVINPKLAFDNYLMTYNVLEYARTAGIRRLVFSSSREIYGESKMTNPVRREGSTFVEFMKSPYTASKFGSEALLHAYRECYPINPVIVRLSNVYGRYDVSERVVPLFTYYAVRHRDITVFGREKRLDFTYIDDCVDGLARIVARYDKVAGTTFNISRGKGERLVELAQMIVEQTGSRSRVGVSTKRVGEISSFVGDIRMARKLLGFDPKVDLKVGLAKTLEWYFKAMKSRRVYETQRRNLQRRGWA